MSRATRRVSAASFSQLQASGALARLEKAVVKALYEKGEASAADVADYLDLPMDSVRNRFAPLERKGVIRVCGNKKDPCTTRIVTVWELSGEQPSEYAKPLSKALRLAIALLLTAKYPTTTGPMSGKERLEWANKLVAKMRQGNPDEFKNLLGQARALVNA